MKEKRFGLPQLGFGVGLRSVHYQHILAERPQLGWFEVLSDNYMHTRGRPLAFLDQIAERYPVALHGVGLSIGSSDDLDFGYLAELRALRDRVGAHWVSDHIRWTGVNGRHGHDLYPVPFTEGALRHIARHVCQVQDYLVSATGAGARQSQGSLECRAGGAGVVRAMRSAVPTTTLHQLQSWLFEQVTELAGPGSARGGRDADTEAELRQQLMSGNLSASARLEVYRHGYFARLVECLEDDYPALAHALGAELFEAVCRDFIALYPPASPSLNYYGAALTEYCGRRSDSWNAFAEELARLEWAVVEAIHAEEGERLDVAALGRLSPEQWSAARLVPSPALRLLLCTYPVAEYYQAFKDGTAAALGADGSALEFLAPRASAVAVCRCLEDVWRIRLSPPLGQLLGSLIAGAPLLDALERVGSGATSTSATDGAPVAPEELQRAFQDWVSCGLFSGVP